MVMSLLSTILTLFVSLVASVGGWWSTIIDQNVVVAEKAAIVATALHGIAEPVTDDGRYSSLIDIINASLQRIKDGVQSTTTNHAISTTEETAVTEDVSAEQDLAEAIVNIYCTTKTSDYKKIISGTGFFISDRGVVLTNAHVGQFLLLEKYTDGSETNCQIKTGESATAAYEVDLLYISPTWLIEHADLISDPAPQGTGENDFALLYVTSTVSETKLPGRFPYLPPSTNSLSTEYQNESVILVGYPQSAVSSGLRITSTTTITNLYTFDSGYADVITLASSPLGHKGASGGPVIDHLGRAIGVITTKDSGSTILNAITLSHIDRALKNETGFDLATTLQGNLAFKAQIFNETVSPILQKLLTNNLE
ncbi:hypothetical protein A2837_02860 [Candidatus Kaiserbacteria bacterium RIFCSPHIGHO2_01_FULL_46_22]|uniref:Serine protease n=1 Tax=Candidatus Kaiserbacteria bacterium RIFCSPHIGHO2_01_FULL_46_22 TaxID=1798475 RepID=A0A1F6BX67_9BACT|nr:MAG: hypothetical protein A2837_02860 [Candidatus Kaiserbacteria bacterium RIFCSPHIGHO2_01_FULL_46_22]